MVVLVAYSAFKKGEQYTLNQPDQVFHFDDCPNRVDRDNICVPCQKRINKIFANNRTIMEREKRTQK